MSFGIDSDIFGFADTTTSRSLQSVTNSGKNASEAQAVDSNGDVAASTLYDTTTGNTITCNYLLCSTGTVDMYDTTTAVDFRLGKVINSYMITGITGSTSNTDFATVAITGQKTNSTDSEVSKYDPGSFNGGQGATAYGVTLDTVTRLTGSTKSITSSAVRALDSAGEELCSNIYGGRIEVSNELVGVTGAPGATADTGYQVLTGPSKSESNTAYQTGTATGFQNLTAM